MTDNTLGLLGLARRAGKLAMGEEPVREACALKHAHLVLVAPDAGESTVRRALRFAREGEVACVTMPWSKAEAGIHLGRASCAMLCVTDGGFAAQVVKGLARGDESLAELARQLEEKTERRKARRAKP